MNPASSGHTQHGPTGDAVRVAIVGAGAIAWHHVHALTKSGSRATITAIVDPAVEARDRLLRVCRAATGYGSLDELLARSRPEVVHICTPGGTHEALASKAIEHGCHVYVEKPVAETARAAEYLIEQGGRARVKLCPGHQLLYQSCARAAYAHLNAIGELVHVEAYFSFRPVRRNASTGRPLAADLQLLDILPHPASLLLHFLEAATPFNVPTVAGLEVGPGPTIQLLVRHGAVTGRMVASLEARPIDSYVRIGGTQGTLHVDFVRDAVLTQISAGTSMFEKIAAPYGMAWQLVQQTTGSLVRRVIRQQRSYPGLTELFRAFYLAVRSGGPEPVSLANLMGTTLVYEEAARQLQPRGQPFRGADTIDASGGMRILVTGGTGFLGRRVVRSLLGQGAHVCSVSRSVPPLWERVDGVTYVTADLAEDDLIRLCHNVDVVVHCAAETNGGWDEHDRNSVRATENILRAAAKASVQTFVHVSSIAVVEGNGEPVDETTPLIDDARSRGAYVWGKSEAERIVRHLAPELGLAAKIVRPAPIIDTRTFSPPGRLGRSIGNLFVAVGPASDPFPWIDVDFAADCLAWIALHPADAPPVLNLLDSKVSTKKAVAQRLHSTMPRIRVVWLPYVGLRLLAYIALVTQRVRGSKDPVNLAHVFRRERYRTDLIAGLEARIQGAERRSAPVETATFVTETLPQPVPPVEAESTKGA